MEERLYSDATAAEYIAQRMERPTSSHAVKRWRRTGRIGYRRIGKFARMSQADLDAFLAGERVPGRESA